MIKNQIKNSEKPSSISIFCESQIGWSKISIIGIENTSSFLKYSIFEIEIVSIIGFNITLLRFDDSSLFVQVGNFIMAVINSFLALSR